MGDLDLEWSGVPRRSGWGAWSSGGFAENTNQVRARIVRESRGDRGGCGGRGGTTSRNGCAKS